jgi:S-(hydroxymethyl)glutathione dehydrogenase/alcohol dehydrogenase
LKAAVLDAVGRPLRIADLRLAEPGAGEVSVRIRAAGICHSDYHFMSGDQSHPLPVVLGHEGAGVVDGVGPGVRSVTAGDHVVLIWRASCGRCEWCARGRPALCDMGRTIRRTGMLIDGTTRLQQASGDPVHHFLGVSCFAERVVCSEASVMRIPPDVPLPIAALMGCAVATGVGAVFNTARVEPGSSVLVMGAGGVGLAVIMGAVLAGASRIIAVDRGRARLATARLVGATHVIDASDMPVLDGVAAIAGDGVDYSFEAIGQAETMALAVRALRRAGTAILVGIARHDVAVGFNALDLVTSEKSIKGSLYGSMRPAVDFDRLIGLYRAGRLPLEKLLSRTYPLVEINKAFRAMLDGEVARSVVVP